MLDEAAPPSTMAFASSSQSSLELEQFKAAVSQSSSEVFTKSMGGEVSQKPSFVGPPIRKKSKPSQLVEKFHPGENENDDPRMVTPRTKMLCQRMASDTDLWISLKAAQAKYQTTLEATKESPTTSNDFLINHVEMPTSSSLAGASERNSSSKKSPTPSHERVLNQEEFDRRLKAKRASFLGKGRSLSLASFTLPVRKVPRLLPLGKAKSSSPKTTSKSRNKSMADEKYLEENRVQGELEILGLESLIDINDVKSRSNKK